LGPIPGGGRRDPGEGRSHAHRAADNGVDNMDYMYSLNSTNNSSTALMVDFDLKTDPNMDLILTQSRQQLANGQIPPVVNMIGIDVKKSLTSPMMVISLYSPKGTYDAKFLANYGYINLN